MKFIVYIFSFILLVGIAFPIAFANAQAPTTFVGVVNLIRSLINSAVPPLIAIAVFLFMFGLLRYVTAGDDEQKVKQGRSFIIYGIIGIFIMLSVWGLVNVLLNSVRLNNSTLPNPQQIQIIPPFP